MANKTHGEVAREKQAFIDNFPEYGTVGATIVAIGLKKCMTFYIWCAKDPEFKRIYDEELKPQQRDMVVSQIYRAAMGKIKLTQQQLTAAFGYAKATDKSAQDGLIFREQYAHELSGPGGKEITLKVVYDRSRNIDTPAQS